MDLVAHLGIGGLHADLGQLKQTASRLFHRLLELQNRVDDESAIIKVLLQLLVEQTQSSESEILARVLKPTAKPDAIPQSLSCTACGRTLSRRRTTCNYCGAKRQIESVSELLDR